MKSRPETTDYPVDMNYPISILERFFFKFGDELKERCFAFQWEVSTPYRYFKKKEILKTLHFPRLPDADPTDLPKEGLDDEEDEE